MKHALSALLIAFVPLAARADEKDWTGEWVLPRKPNVPLGDANGKSLGTWSAGPAKVVWTGKWCVQIRRSEGSGPFLREQRRGPAEVFAFKTDVVKKADAQAFFTAKIRADEKSAWAWQMRGEAKLLNEAKEGPDGAIKDLTEAIRLDPKNSSAFLDRGEALVFELDGTMDTTIKDYNEAIRVDPKNALAFIRRGQYWVGKQGFDKAFKDFTEAIRLDPKNADGFNERAAIWLEKKEYDKAIEDINEAVRLDPKNGDRYDERGTLWLELKQYDKAIADLTEAIRLDPKNALTFLSRGTALVEKKEYDRAIKDYTEGIRLDSKVAALFYGRGRLWAGKKDYEKAIKDYTEAIHIFSNYSECINDLAWLYATCPDAKFRDGKKAVANATKACKQTDWKDGIMLSTLAAAYAESGDFDKAVKYQKQALADKEAEKEDGEKMRMRLKLYEQKKPYREP